LKSGGRSLYHTNELSKKAKLLLNEASKKEGEILTFKTTQATIIQANNKQFTPTSIRRDRKYISVIEELETLNYIQPINNERQIFLLTEKGYKYNTSIQ
jgi:hypothetical protein